MSKIIKYEHHGSLVSVQEHLKGTHRDHCLCYQDCKYFRPETQGSHCPRAQELFEYCVKYSMTIPVFECGKYEKGSDN